MCFGIRIGVGGGHVTGKGRGWGNIVERVSWRERVGEHHRKGETSLKGWGNVVHFGIQIGVGDGHATGKGRGWGNVVPGETLSTCFQLCDRKGERVDTRQTESSWDSASCGSKYEVRGGVWVVAMCVG